MTRTISQGMHFRIFAMFYCAPGKSEPTVTMECQNTRRSFSVSDITRNDTAGLLPEREPNGSRPESLPSRDLLKRFEFYPQRTCTCVAGGSASRK
jgi:hypothetical protein